jgi:hypothetical protein
MKGKGGIVNLMGVRAEIGFLSNRSVLANLNA